MFIFLTSKRLSIENLWQEKIHINENLGHGMSPWVKRTGSIICKYMEQNLRLK